MTDVCVYYFHYRRGGTGQLALSARRATIETIGKQGQPVMESQIVVDSCQLNAQGYFDSAVSTESHPMDELWSEIRSLELRADSRDQDAKSLEDCTYFERKNKLLLESRELRSKATALRKRRADMMIEALYDDRGQGGSRDDFSHLDAV